MPLVVFGDQLSEMNNISYCIEHAFDTHRQKLINIVEKLAQIDEQMNQFDDIYGNMLTSVHNRFVSFASSLPQCWELNEHFLRELIQPHAVPFTLGILPASSLSPLTPVRFGKDKHNDISSYNSLVQVLVHLDRDWSKDGENVRNILYRRGVLRYLDLYFPLNGEESDAPSVLIPGAGLGRLGFDIALAGYRVGNSCIEYHILLFNMYNVDPMHCK